MAILVCAHDLNFRVGLPTSQHLLMAFSCKFVFTLLSDYLPSSGQHGTYPPYYGAGQDVRFTQPEESKWNGENSHSPARNLSSLATHGRFPPTTGHAKHK
jgi:hypothetical protein